MVPSQNDFLGSGLSYDELVEFSPNEPGTPFGDNLAHQFNMICHQFGDNKTPVLPQIRLLPVTKSINSVEVMEKGGDLIYLDEFAFFRVASK